MGEKTSIVRFILIKLKECLIQDFVILLLKFEKK
jgi:hypothetical protein